MVYRLWYRHCFCFIFMLWAAVTYITRLATNDPGVPGYARFFLANESHTDARPRTKLNVFGTGCTSSQPVNIAFIKVHKCGSSTLANVFARYALSNDLNVALPNKPPNIPRYNYFETVQKDMVLPLTEGQQYNVLFNHMIYNRTTLVQLMPKDTFYCAVMRTPVSRFLSSANYYQALLPARVKQYLFNETFAETNSPPTQGALAQVIQGVDKLRMEHFTELYNSIASDSGLLVKDQMNESRVREHVDKLDRELDLMMVMEQFDESLVLLKRRACLSLKDIVYFKLNSGQKKYVRHLTDAEIQFLRDWQMADHIIYDHFYKKFQEEMKNEGEQFLQEVKHFKEILADTQKFCSDVRIENTDVLVVKMSMWNDQFTLNAEDCKLLQMSELNFQNRLINRAAKRRWKRDGSV